MRSYHKHMGCVGSHKISIKHKSSEAQREHSSEVRVYNKSNGNGVWKVQKKKTVKKPVLSRAADKFQDIMKGKKVNNEKFITLPIDKNGTIIADLTKILKPLYIKTITIVNWNTRKQEVVEFKFSSLPSGKGIEKDEWEQKKN